MFRHGIPVNARALGAVALVVAAASLWLGLAAHDGVPLAKHTYVDAAFDDVASVLARNDVRVAGVRVGQVHRVRYEDHQAIVTLQLPAGYAVHGDAAAAVGARNALGQRFIALSPGTPAAGPLRGRIPKDRTSSAVELDQVLDELDGPTRQALQQALRSLGTGATGHSGDLSDLLAAAPELLADMGTIAGDLASGDAQLVALLAATERLAGRFSGRDDEVAALASDLGKTLAALSTSRGAALDAALARAPGALDATDGALKDLTGAVAATRQAVAALAPASAGLGDAAADLRAALREAPGPLRRIPGVASVAGPATGELTGLATDARPLAADVRRALHLAHTPLAVLAPYAAELGHLFTMLRSATDDGDANGNWLRFAPAGGPATLSPGPDRRTPASPRNPYPAPGQAGRDRATGARP
ncbi:MAG: MlaD family protein [Actinomycetota bacterium]|jgi:phospholipid/cholesterol/gamma-HCH transport system substrate-binding protein